MVIHKHGSIFFLLVGMFKAKQRCADCFPSWVILMVLFLQILSEDKLTRRVMLRKPHISHLTSLSQEYKS